MSSSWEPQSEVEKALGTADGLARLTKRRGAFADLAATFWALEDREAIADAIHLVAREGAWFTINQGAASAAARRLTLNVEMCGMKVGTLEISPGAAKGPFLFNPCLRDLMPLDDVPWSWSKSPADGVRIRRYFALIREQNASKGPLEREIQWQLADYLATTTTGAAKYLQPVYWLEAPTEIATSITRESNVGTGNIDLVLRRLGGSVGARFLVLELKGIGKTDVRGAISQAIRYAVAIHIEANDGDKARADYRTVLGSSGSEPLKFGAVAAVEDTNENRELARLALQELMPPPKAKVDCLGVLLYRWDPAARTATDWRWLEGWDPRKPIEQSQQPK